MISVRDSLHVFVDNQIARTLADDARATVASLADHEMGVVDIDGILMDEGSAGLTGKEKLFIVQRHGIQLVWSPPIRRNSIVSYNGQDYTAPVQQVTHIGYDGASTTADIEAISDNTYIARVLIQDAVMFQDKQMYKFGVYKSDASATKEEVTNGLASNLIANFSRESVENRIRVERLSNNAGLVPTGTTTVFGFTYNSATVTIDGTLTNVAVGDYIRISAGTTIAVYRVTAYTASTSITLDVPYQGATSTGVAIAGVRRVLAADFRTGLQGIQLRAVARRFVVGQFKYFNTRFRVTLQDAGTTPVTYTTGANEGMGYGAAIMEQEWFALGTEGFIERIGVPAPVLPRQIAVETTPYSVLKIVCENPVGGTAVSTPAAARNEILIAGSRAGGIYGTSFYENGGASDAGICDTLNAYLLNLVTAYTPA